MNDPVKDLNITTILLDDSEEDDDGITIDLQLHNIRDKTIILGKAQGAVNIEDFAKGLKKVMVKYATQYGDVAEYE
jgi:hypothetical protein